MELYARMVENHDFNYLRYAGTGLCVRKTLVKAYHVKVKHRTKCFTFSTFPRHSIYSELQIAGQTSLFCHLLLTTVAFYENRFLLLHYEKMSSVTRYCKHISVSLRICPLQAELSQFQESTLPNSLSICFPCVVRSPWLGAVDEL